VKYTDRYDELIKMSADRHMPPNFNDWRRNKAQLIQESGLDPDAESEAGAQGIAQFMPLTWENDVIPGMRLVHDASPFQTQYAIPANAWYDHKLWLEWTNPQRTLLDRWHLTLASYNAGFGNLLEAQKLAHGALGYEDIVAQLHHVTGEANAKQTRDYITRIERIYAELLAA
jgi:soluble lytic murein transglycosylase-like protein